MNAVHFTMGINHRKEYKETQLAEVIFTKNGGNAIVRKSFLPTCVEEREENTQKTYTSK